MDFKYKTVAEINALSADEQEKYLADKKTHEDKVRKDEMDKAVKDALAPLLTEQGKTTKDIGDLAEKIDVLGEKMKVNGRAELKGLLQETLKESHEAIIEAFKNNTPLKDIVIEKVPAMHMTNNGTVTNITGLTYPNSTFEVDNDIAYIRIPDNFILNYIRNTQTEKVPAQVLKMQQVAGEGAAAITAEGEVKPLLQYKFQRTSTARKKYAGRVEWTEEFEMDFDALLDAIIDMLERDVITTWQDDIIEIIDANATTYIGSSLDGTLVKPDNGLVVVAVAQQIKALGFVPNLAIMHPADIDAAVYTQDQNGNFSLKPYIDASGNKINGLTVVPSLKMTQGEALIGDFNIYKERHSRVIIRKGQYNAQFIENEYTLVCEVFSVLNAAPANYPAIVKVNLATVRASLQLNPTP